jgi:GxxExxY protein
MNDRQGAKDAKANGQEPGEVFDDLARRVIGAAIEVHRHLGPGFGERVYEEALAVELRLRDVPFSQQPSVPVRYKGFAVGVGRPDFVVGIGLVVEIKAVSSLSVVHQAQIVSYLKALGSPLGLLLNFKEATMRRGTRRVVWSRGRCPDGERGSPRADPCRETDQGHVSPRGDTPILLEPLEEGLDAIA